MKFSLLGKILGYLGFNYCKDCGCKLVQVDVRTYYYYPVYECPHCDHLDRFDVYSEDIELGERIDRLAREILVSDVKVDYLGSLTTAKTAKSDVLSIADIKSAVEALKNEQCRPFYGSHYLRELSQALLFVNKWDYWLKRVNIFKYKHVGNGLLVRRSALGKHKK